MKKFFVNIVFIFVLSFYAPLSFAGDSIPSGNVEDIKRIDSTDADYTSKKTTEARSVVRRDSIGSRRLKADGIKAVEVKKVNTDIKKDALLNYILNYNVYSSFVVPAKPSVNNENGAYFEGMSPIFMPLVFNSVKRDFKLKRKDISHSRCRLKLTTSRIDSMGEVFRARRYLIDLSRNFLLSEELKNLAYIKYDQGDLPKPEKLVFRLDSRKPHVWSRRDLSFKNSLKLPDKGLGKLPKMIYNPWTFKGNSKLMFSQNYFSSNWASGSESNIAGLFSLNLSMLYDNLVNLTFESTLDLKLGINTVASDSLRDYNVTTDQLRIYSKFGYKIYNDWYYSLSSEFITQVLNKYNQNSMQLASSFLSPAKWYIGIGTTYRKKGKNDKYKLSLDLAPLTVKLNYLENTKDFDPSDYGIKEGRHFASELGSKVSLSFLWKITETVNWKSNFYYYSDFSYSDLDFQNTVNFNLLDNISAQIYLYTVLDDRVDRDPGESLLQLQEYFSLGISYFW